jgi:hypothetical protein
LRLGVVGRSALCVAEDRPRLVDCHHAGSVTTEVRVVLARQRSIGRSDDLDVGVSVY